MRKKRPRRPRFAEIVANQLRTEILDGTLHDGALLPRQEELMDRFDESLVTIREALRILETEGLVTIRRGNVGGAIVHLPSDLSIARMVSFVLQHGSATLDDVRDALALIEPVCAGMCASRADRHESVLPHLNKAHQKQLDAADDVAQWAPLSVGFHDALITHCGNATLEIVVGTLQAIWATHAQQQWDQEFDPHEAGDMIEPTREHSTYFAASKASHEEILAAIDTGDHDNASTIARVHLAQNRRLVRPEMEKMPIAARLISDARI